VESFAATLEEAMQADLLVHVADASSSEHELSEMLSAVEAVLSDIDASDRAQLLVLNKIDLVDEKRRRELSFRYPRAIQVSGATGEGTTQLCEAIDRWFVSRLRLMRLLVPYDEGKRLSELHDLAGEVRREDTFQGVRVDARVPAELAGRFERFSIEGIGQNGHESE
jgi:GTP-binding protein HflX